MWNNLRSRVTSAVGRGAAAETASADYLRRQGLEIVARNVRYRQGELDLIARDGDTLVFVEVRQRRSDSHGTAAETVTAAKQRKLIRAAQQFLTERGWQERYPCRFDVITWRDPARDASPQWTRDAFHL